MAGAGKASIFSERKTTDSLLLVPAAKPPEALRNATHFHSFCRDVREARVRGVKNGKRRGDGQWRQPESCTCFATLSLSKDPTHCGMLFRMLSTLVMMEETHTE